MLIEHLSKEEREREREDEKEERSRVEEGEYKEGKETKMQL